MRLVFSLAFASVALASLAVPAAFAGPNTGTGVAPAPKAPVAVPLAPKPTPTATPTAVPTSAATALPTVLTMEISPYSKQSRFSAPLLDFRLASTSTTPQEAGKISFNSFSVLLPLGANSTTLEKYYQDGTAFPEVDVFIPPNTQNVFKLVKIKSFSENVTNTQSSVQFALLYGGMEIKTVPTPNPLLPVREKMPALNPGHAP